MITRGALDCWMDAYGAYLPAVCRSRDGDGVCFGVEEFLTLYSMPFALIGLEEAETKPHISTKKAEFFGTATVSFCFCWVTNTQTDTLFE